MCLSIVSDQGEMGELLSSSCAFLRPATEVCIWGGLYYTWFCKVVIISGTAGAC